MAARLVTVTSNAPDASTLTLVDGTASTGYSVLEGAEFGNSVFEQAYSGPRGTQGARVASSTPKNRPLVLPILIDGTSKDNAAALMSALFTVGDELRRFGGRVRWRSTNQTYAQSFEVMGGEVSVEKFGHQGEVQNKPIVLLSCSCAPLLLWDRMEVEDDFSSDSLSDYTFDAGASSNVAVAAGQLDAVNNLTTENRAVHTDTGYDLGDVQVTGKFVYQQVSGFKAGVVFKRTAANTYLEVYIDDTGTNTRLRLDTVIAGARTNLQSTTLGARVADGTSFWVRGRIEGDVVYREYFTDTPTPMGTPASAPASQTLTGGDLTAFGSAVEGKAGWSWVPQHTNGKLDDFAIEPYVRRNLTLPANWSLNGPLLGDAPPLADVTITHAGGSADPVFALIGWNARQAGSNPPFGVIEAESGSFLVTWAVTGDADYRGTSGLQATTSGAGNASASWSIDPSLLLPDDHSQGDVDLEVWARIELASTVVSPRLIPTLSPSSSTTRYTNEWGSVGFSPVLPSGGTRFRFVKVGTFPAYVDRTEAPAWTINFNASWSGGSSGTFGVDYLVVVPARARALSPTAKANSFPAYPRFLWTTGEASKLIRSDLSAQASSPPAAFFPTHGLGGSLIELPTGDVDMLVKLSSLVPDDPTSDATSEQLSHAATVKVSPTPRSYFLRAE